MKGSDWFLTKMKNKKKQQEQDTKPMLTHQHLHLFFQIFYPNFSPWFTLDNTLKYQTLTTIKTLNKHLPRTSKKTYDLMRFMCCFEWNKPRIILGLQDLQSKINILDKIWKKMVFGAV